jgi:hypothetical protein
MLLIAGYADNAGTRTYALGGMQAACKPARRLIGVFEPATLQNSTAIF